MENDVKLKYRLFKRAGVYYYEDTETRKQLSLKTKDKREALRLLGARNESQAQHSSVNFKIAEAYLAASDPIFAVARQSHVPQSRSRG